MDNNEFDSIMEGIAFVECTKAILWFLLLVAIFIGKVILGIFYLLVPYGRKIIAFFRHRYGFDIPKEKTEVTD